jgi:hypothetical protein
MSINSNIVFIRRFQTAITVVFIPIIFILLVQWMAFRTGNNVLGPSSIVNQSMVITGSTSTALSANASNLIKILHSSPIPDRFLENKHEKCDERL